MSRVGSRATLLALALLAAITASGAVVVRSITRVPADTVEAAGQAGARVLDKARELAAAFRSERVEHTFREHLVALAGTGALEVARLESDETFAVRDEKRVLWDALSLGETVSEIRVPAVYRYQVSASRAAWQVAAQGATLAVTAPRLEPVLPVAFRSEAMQERSHSGWARWNADEQLAELRRQITPLLGERAARQQQIAAVREVARATVARLVREWLQAGDAFRPGGYTTITVRFADEAAPPGAPGGG